MDQQAEKDQTERVTGQGRRTREEIVKWNQMTALRFQTGERHQSSPASLRGREEVEGLWLLERGLHLKSFRNKKILFYHTPLILLPIKSHDVFV